MEPKTLLQHHLDCNPKITIVASVTESGQLYYGASGPGSLSDLTLLHKLLGLNIDEIIAQALKKPAAPQETEVAQ